MVQLHRPPSEVFTPQSGRPGFKPNSWLFASCHPPLRLPSFPLRLSISVHIAPLLAVTVMWSFETHFPKSQAWREKKVNWVWIKTQSAASIKIQSHGFLSVSHSWGGNANYLHSHPQPIACLDNPWARHLRPITARQRWNSSTRARWESCMCSPVGGRDGRGPVFGAVWRFQMFILPAAPRGCQIVFTVDSFRMMCVTAVRWSSDQCVWEASGQICHVVIHLSGETDVAGSCCVKGWLCVCPTCVLLKNVYKTTWHSISHQGCWETICETCVH